MKKKVPLSFFIIANAEVKVIGSFGTSTAGVYLVFRNPEPAWHNIHSGCIDPDLAWVKNTWENGPVPYGIVVDSRLRQDVKEGPSIHRFIQQCWHPECLVSLGSVHMLEIQWWRKQGRMVVLRRGSHCEWSGWEKTGKQATVKSKEEEWEVRGVAKQGVGESERLPSWWDLW